MSSGLHHAPEQSRRQHQAQLCSSPAWTQLALLAVRSKACCDWQISLPAALPMAGPLEGQADRPANAQRQPSVHGQF